MAYLVFVTEQTEIGDRDTLVGKYESEAEAKESFDYHQRAYGGAWLVSEQEFEDMFKIPEWTEEQQQAYHDSFEWDDHGNGHMRTRH